jgi:DNA-binding CsgD family transcriptional regulator
MARIVVVAPSTLLAQGIVAALDCGGHEVTTGSASDDADAWVVHGEELTVRGANGAFARLSADTTPQQLAAAVAAVLVGLSVRDTPWQIDTIDSREPLTPRELEVFELLAKGLSNREIGEVLAITAHTAKFHVGQILAKTGTSTRAEAVHEGIRLGLIGL